jgi:AraC-like DNA-binding protein
MHDPIGRFVAGRSFIVWVHSPRLAGSVYFDRTDERDIPALIAMYSLALHARFEPPFDVLVDLSELTGFSAESFRHLGEHIELVGAFAPRIKRVSVVRPAGMIGATIAGLFYDLNLTGKFRCGLFTDRAEAFRWLDSPDGAAAEGALEAVLAEVRGTPPVLRDLREWLAKHLDDPQLGRAARALGHSERSLQRRLGELSTAFRAEVQRARVRAAEALLLDGDAKLAAIARQVGCSSPSQLAAMFRRATGETPGDFRARRLAQI